MIEKDELESRMNKDVVEDYTELRNRKITSLKAFNSI